MSDTDSKKVAFLSDGYTEEFCIPEGDDYPAVKGTFRPQTSIQGLGYRQKAKALGEEDEVGLARVTADMLADVIQTWDIVDERGEPVEVSTTNMERLEFSLTEELLKTVAGDKERRRQEADRKNS